MQVNHSSVVARKDCRVGWWGLFFSFLVFGVFFCFLFVWMVLGFCLFVFCFCGFFVVFVCLFCSGFFYYFCLGFCLFGIVTVLGL